MFDLSADDGSVRRKVYKSPIPGDRAGETPKPATNNQLNSPGMLRLHKQMLDTYRRELDRQAANRAEMARDDDCYDNDMWSDTDKATLEERGQVPLVYNVMSASIDWITGTERRSRTDFKVLPRRKEDGKPAEKKTQLMKYLADVNRTQFDVSRSFEDAVKVGLGWIEDGLQGDDEGEPIYSRHESWRNILFDSSANDLDLNKDGRYIIRTKWLDLDVAIGTFPNRRNLLRQSAANAQNYGAWRIDDYADDAMDAKEIALDVPSSSRTTDRLYGFQRQRVRCIEMWVKIPVSTKRMRGGQFAGELFDDNSPGHQSELDSGAATVNEKIALRTFVAIFTEAGMLYFGPSPYRHNRFPLTPIWGFRRGRDGLPYGLIRRLRDIQDDVNKRASKAQWMMSVNRIVMDEGAYDDLDELLEEAARPDAVLVKRKGYELRVENNVELSQFQLELMSRSIAMVQSAAGVNEDNLGRQTNAQSGIAIQRRQDQGSMTTVKFFDNLTLAQQIRGEIVLSLIEQFMTEEKQFRITNMRGTPDYIKVNDGLPENDIVRCKSDFVITDQEWRASLRQAAVDSLLEAMSKFPPDIIILMLDLIVENMDLPNRDEIVRRIRTVNKQRDPDATEMTPEEQQQQAAAAQQNQIQMQQVLGQIRKLMAEADKTEAQTEDIRAGTVQKRVAAQNAALDAGGKAIMAPPAAHAADHIMAEAGFVAASDRQPPAAPPPGGSLAEQPGFAAYVH